MRSGAESYISALTASQLRPAIFVTANFTSGPIYVWNGIGTISWNGYSWIGVGSLGTISTIEESPTVEAKGISLSLSGVPSTLLADVLTEFQVGLPCAVYLGLFDSSGALLPSPLTCWAGLMDQPTIDVSGDTATITINCENRLVNMNVAVDRRRTNEDQQIDHPGDRGLEFVSSLQSVTIYWGRSPNSKNNV